MPNPYQQQHPSSSQSRFPFANSRFLQRPDPQAPLFYSATDDFHDDEGDEHEREVADFYALQRSRQQFGPSNLTESSEMDDDGLEKVEGGQDHDRDDGANRGRTRASRLLTRQSDGEPDGDSAYKGKGRLVDVNLASTIDEEPPESLVGIAAMQEPDDRPPPFQTFRTQPAKEHPRYSSFLPQETDEEAQLHNPRPPSPDRESVPPTVILPSQEPPKHDAFWASLYQISLFAMFATFVLIWFHTSAPSSEHPLGDSIYSALRSSTYMLLWDTVLAVIVALVWQTLLKHYVRGLIYGLIVVFPVVLFAFSLYPFISSFHPVSARAGKPTIQDQAMRYLAVMPFTMGIFFLFSVYKWRYALYKSINILEFSTRVLATSPYLMISGFASLAANVLWTWLWLLMFERIFLSGHFTLTGTKRFLLDANAWWLAVFFFLEYLWTLGVIAGVQRATTAATVSQWYFHRFSPAQPSSRDVVKASFLHATGALFGTVCLSTLLSLLVRLPLIILPGRISGVLNMCAYWLIPTTLATLTNPLTLTYAAVHSQPLGIAARGLATLNSVSRSNPSNTLGTRNFNPVAQSEGSLVPYRLAKLLLQTTRWLMSFGLGFGGWIRTAHSLEMSAADGSGAGLRGSLYAYVVGLIAATIGFAVLGAVENVVSGVLDAAVVCWASETAGGRGEARYCREAGEMFGGEDGL